MTTEREHLEAFASAFVLPRYRDRWRHVLVERPEKAASELVKFERHLDPRFCAYVESLDPFLRDSHAPPTGVYFDGVGGPKIFSFDEAWDTARMNCRDALFSLIPGRIALFFGHEGDTWGCKRPNRP